MIINYTQTNEFNKSYPLFTYGLHHMDKMVQECIVYKMQNDYLIRKQSFVYTSHNQYNDMISL